MKTILITGCSSGIGRALAEEFMKRGQRVVATARRPETLAPLAAAGAVTLRLDVNEAAAVASLPEALAALGVDHLDLLVNNAGYGQFGAVIDSTPEDLRRQFETNVIAPVALTRALLPLLRKGSKAGIANIGSISGLVTTPFAGVYCASKAALHALSDALRMELAPFGLHVVTVQPGGIASSFGDNGTEHISLPEGSLYAPIARKIQGRARMSQQGATPAAEFATTVVSHLLQADPAPICKTGKSSTRLPLMKRLLPLTTLDRKMREMFGLEQLHP